MMMGTAAKSIDENISLWQIIAVRQSVLLVYLTPMFLREGRKCFETEVLGLHLLRVIFASVALLGGLYAVRNLSLADATVIGFSKVIFATLAAWLLFGERVGIRRVTATAIGFLGVVIVANPNGDAFNTAGFIAIIGACGAGVVVNLLRKLALRDTIERMILYQATLVGLIVLPLAIVEWIWVSPLQWFLLVLVGLFSLGSQYCNINGYRLGETSFVVPMDYFRILPAVAIGFWFFSESPGWHTSAGASMIIAASLYTSWREMQLKKLQQSRQ